ncbi:MAG: CHAD domain-containing protein [Saprospirales bacterium]|nr:CHAD domain-containing protein [Saprospirales bacterium]
MARALFLRILKKRLRRIRQTAARPDRLCRDSRALHTFRVALKRWRAQLRLLRAVDPAFPYQEVYEPFKAIFSTAGDIRFWQLQGIFLHGATGVPDAFIKFYHSWIRQHVRDARSEFRQVLRAADLPRWRDIKAELRESAERCNPATLGAYFKRLQEAAEACRPGGGAVSARQELHELRKILKEYGINRRYAARCWAFDPGEAVPGLPLDHTAADELLGAWHDLDAAGSQLANDRRQQAWPANRQAGGAPLAAAWQRREKALLREVKRAFRKSR